MDFYKGWKPFGCIDCKALPVTSLKADRTCSKLVILGINNLKNNNFNLEFDLVNICLFTFLQCQNLDNFALNFVQAVHFLTMDLGSWALY